MGMGYNQLFGHAVIRMWQAWRAEQTGTAWQQDAWNSFDSNKKKRKTALVIKLKTRATVQSASPVQRCQAATGHVGGRRTLTLWQHEAVQKLTAWKMR